MEKLGKYFMTLFGIIGIFSLVSIIFFVVSWILVLGVVLSPALALIVFSPDFEIINCSKEDSCSVEEFDEL